MTTTEQMNCQELVELVTEYFEGTLSPPDRARFEDHLEACRYCTTYLEQMRTTIAALGALDPDQLSPEASAALLSAFRDWKRTGDPDG